MTTWILFLHRGADCAPRELARAEAPDRDGAWVRLAALARDAGLMAARPSPRTFFVQSEASVALDGPARRLRAEPFRAPRQDRGRRDDTQR